MKYRHLAPPLVEVADMDTLDADPAAQAFAAAYGPARDQANAAIKAAVAEARDRLSAEFFLHLVADPSAVPLIDRLRNPHQVLN